jgi:hypothetical protein
MTSTVRITKQISYQYVLLVSYMTAYGYRPLHDTKRGTDSAGKKFLPM